MVKMELGVKSRKDHAPCTDVAVNALQYALALIPFYSESYKAAKVSGVFTKAWVDDEITKGLPKVTGPGNTAQNEGKCSSLDHSSHWNPVRHLVTLAVFHFDIWHSHSGEVWMHIINIQIMPLLN